MAAKNNIIEIYGITFKSKPFENRTNCPVFEWYHHLKTELQKVRFSNVSGFRRVGFQIPTVFEWFLLFKRMEFGSPPGYKKLPNVIICTVRI